MNELGVAILAAVLGGAPPCSGRAEAVRAPVLLPVEGPQDIAVDGEDGSIWISSAVSSTVLHLGPTLEVRGSFEAPFTTPGRDNVTGIAWVPGRETLLLVQPASEEIWEVEEDGTPTGLVVSLAALPRPPNVIPRPYAKGIAFDPTGDGGQGSIWLVEAVLTAIYEISLDGRILRSFCHPDDPDGCPGSGRAAPSGGIDLVFEGGVLAAIELTGGQSDEIVRVDPDGNPTGVRIALAEAGGRVGGFAHARIPTTAGGMRDVLLVSVESSAELQVLEVEEPSILSIDRPVCAISSGWVELGWRGFSTYDRIEIVRNGGILQTLAGDAVSFSDASPPTGLVEYQIVAVQGTCESRVGCSVLLGSGQVLRRSTIGARYPLGIAEDADGNLWITESEGGIIIHDADLGFLASFPGPFQGEGDEISAIASSPATRTMFVYNAHSNEVAEIDPTGALVAPPFPSGVPSDPEHPAFVSGMVFDPATEGGEGSFRYLDYVTGTIQERRRDGSLVGECLHPDWVSLPPPAGSDLGPYLGALSTVPGSSLLSTAGGRIRDGRLTRILRLSPAGCEGAGPEIPVEGISAFGVPYYFAHMETTRGGHPVIIVALPGTPEANLLEIDASPPDVPRLGDLECRQTGDTRNVRLSFRNPGSLDSVEVERDGVPIASLAGDSVSFDDQGLPAGIHEYSVRGRWNGATGDPVRCRLRVGIGSIARREFAFPASLAHEISPDPLTGDLIVASYSHRASNFLSRFDGQLRYLDSIPSPFVLPEQVAALAVRDAGGEIEIYCLGWNPGVSQAAFPLRVLDRAGRLLRELTVEPPRPRGQFVPFPSGLAWDSGTDTLWLLERNSRTVSNLSLQGEILSVFTHPAPPHQDGVYNYGIAVDGERGVLLLSSAGRLERQIDRIVEVTRGGTLTGAEVPVGGLDYDKVWGFSLTSGGAEIAAFASSPALEDLVVYRAFDPVAPVRGLACERSAEGVRLSWRNGESYDAISVFRDGVQLAELPGGATAWADESPDPGPGFYRIVGRKGDLSAPGSICGPLRSRPFVRGDAEESGDLNISDAIAILSFLFLGGAEPGCLDAADADDSGAVEITDGIFVLGFLFLSGPAPPAPFPYPGLDLTPDGLACNG